MKRNLFGLIVGLIVGHLAVVTLSAQTGGSPGKVTVSGWALCVDFQSRDVPLTLGIDGGGPVAAAGVQWEGQAAPFTAKLPLSAFPAAGRTVGIHTAVVTAPSQTVTMADGTPFTIPGGSVSISYEVISETGPAPSNPRWLRIVQAIAKFFARLFGTT